MPHRICYQFNILALRRQFAAEHGCLAPANYIRFCYHAQTMHCYGEDKQLYIRRPAKLNAAKKPIELTALLRYLIRVCNINTILSNKRRNRMPQQDRHARCYYIFVQIAATNSPTITNDPLSWSPHAYAKTTCGLRHLRLPLKLKTQEAKTWQHLLTD